MAQNVTVAGASYSDVPAVELPKTGGGTAKFTDVSPTTAAAADVASGKTFFDAAGVLTTGTGSGGGGSSNIDTKLLVPEDYATSISAEDMKGMPKMFSLRSMATISSSGSTSYYYVVSITSNGTTTQGTFFRVGSTRRIQNSSDGYSWSYSGATLTIMSSASSRSVSPGAFYGNYELIYAY